ncbi:MAG TPA: YkvA family protein [Pyrinomonadaceae bacterium]|jgi:uncharacterized membrane protein YkvA (DUF1232 family)
MSEIEPVKNKSKKPTRKEKVQLKSRMSNLMMFLPNLLRLLGRLLTDGKVPTAEKALFAAAIIYVIVPLDFIPDVFPFIGQVDDIYLVALTLLRLINRTDESIVRRHWTGGGDIIGLADSIAGIAPMLLPKRVSRVLSAKVELADAGRALQNITKKRKAVVAEIPPDEDAPKIKD